jgi:hypothetical protein
MAMALATTRCSTHQKRKTPAANESLQGLAGKKFFTGRIFRVA